MRPRNARRIRGPPASAREREVVSRSLSLAARATVQSTAIPTLGTSHCASRTKSLVNGQSTNHRIPFYRLTDQTLWLLARGFSGFDGAAVDHGHDPVEIIGGCELDGDPALVPTDGDLHPGVKVIGEKRRDGCFTF